MFKEKVTVDQLQHTQDVNLDSFRTIWAELRKIQRRQDDQADTISRYSVRLTKIMRELERAQNVVDHNAQQGENANSAIREAYIRLDEVKSAIELLATEIGTKLDVLPEVPAVVTVQPGLPERLGLVKLTKAEKKAAQSDALPTPIQLTAGELNRGLQLV